MKVWVVFFMLILSQHSQSSVIQDFYSKHKSCISDLENLANHSELWAETPADLSKYDDLIKFTSSALGEEHSFKFKKIVSKNIVLKRAKIAQILMFTDTHGNKKIKDEIGDIIEAIESDSKGKTKSFFIAEFIQPAFQDSVDRFSRGEVSVEALEQLVDYSNQPFNNYKWEKFSDLLLLLRKLNVPIIAGFAPSLQTGWYEVSVRDNYTLDLIERILKNDSKSRIYLMQGAYHLQGDNLIRKVIEKFDLPSIRFVTDSPSFNYELRARGVALSPLSLGKLKSKHIPSYYYTTSDPGAGDLYGLEMVHSFILKLVPSDVGAILKGELEKLQSLQALATQAPLSKEDAKKYQINFRNSFAAYFGAIRIETLSINSLFKAQLEDLRTGRSCFSN